ncbi:fibrillin-2-like [Ruditapes philippinarum]|uniref:fibrillin-2-like n=1 Tax=Ruditapes philippinarum TaxID=129788 RepID=UPI00295B6D09|nr:fibrillin-2-like [Ruditapes philippinarum]
MCEYCRIVYLSCNTGLNIEADGFTCTDPTVLPLFTKIDIDECTANTDNCDDTNGGCTNTAGSFTCSCYTGFNLEADGFTCTDIDECTANTDNCDDTNGGCKNTAGSFTCLCKAGYKLDVDGFTCIDIDECSTYTNICGRSDRLCTNTDGSFTCSCNTGYILYNNSCTVAPETPRGFTIDYIQHNKARLSWLPGNNGGLTQTFVIQLGTGESSWEDIEVQDGVKQNDQPISKILTGLIDSTTYFVRMYAYNNVGNSSLSEILSFTTSPIKVETETKTTTTLIVGIVLSVVIVVVISYAIYVTIQLKRTRNAVQKDGRVQKKDGQVNIHIEDSTNIPDSGGYENPYTDLKTEMRDSRSPYEAISTM